MAPEQVPEPASRPAAGSAAEGEGDGTSRQPPAQPSLPFPEPDDPIPYALTARARRTVAPATLPELSVVPEVPTAGLAPEPVDDPDPFDPRPARARALLRAGRDVPQIAGLLGVGEDLVAAWCRTVGPRADRRRARSGGSSGAEVRRLPLPEPDRHAPQRQRGREQALDDLGEEATEAVVTAFLAGRARLTPHAATFHVADPDEAARIVGWLVDLAGADPSRARLVLEVAPGTAHDLAEARWGQGTGIAAEHLTVSVARDGERATLRVADPDVAATLAGWQDAFMEVTAPTCEDG